MNLEIDGRLVVSETDSNGCTAGLPINRFAIDDLSMLDESGNTYRLYTDPADGYILIYWAKIWSLNHRVRSLSFTSTGPEPQQAKSDASN